jgi:hypothetical protein
MTEIVSFYKGLAPDAFGRTITDIWAYSDQQLEDIHNYIQRLFPNRTPSAFVNAPLLDDATVRAFHEDEDLRRRLLTSFDRMLRFYGLVRAGEQVVRGRDFAVKARNWLTPYNHNFLRITRILLCLKELGLGAWAGAFFRCLEEIHTEHPEIGSETFGYWRNTVS